MKFIHHLVLLALVFITMIGCQKVEPRSGRESQDAIGFSTYFGRAVTKATAGLNQDFNVVSFATSDQSKYFPSSTYTWDGSAYTTTEARYWPASGTLDFYAVSPLSYTDTLSASKTIAADSLLTVAGLGGKTDIIAARKIAAENGKNVALAFGHKLTKVAFKTIGSETDKKYEVLGVVLVAGSTSTLTLSESESWSEAVDPYRYTVLDTTKTLAVNTTTSVSLGDALYLLPNQNSVTLNVKYKVYEGDILIDDKSTAGVDVTLDKSQWGINTSLVYTLTLGIGAKQVGFTADLADWDADKDDKVNVPTQAPDPLKFTAESEQSVYLYKTTTSSSYSPKLEYSFDGKVWQTWDYSDLTFGTSDHPSVYIRGDNPNGLAKDNTVYCYFKFRKNVEVEASGNLMSLINKKELVTEIPNSCCFYYLFYQSPLSTSPELPATVLKESCYRAMFCNATKLKECPELPARKLAPNCYTMMFRGCSLLTDAPELPATTLANGCYYDMFLYCYALKNVPDLPATKLEANCYQTMFSYCTSLENAPAIAATTLASNCCDYMFSNCSNLVNVPDLPAKTMAPSCYIGMFSSCTSLKTAPAIKAETLNTGCFNNMFNKCISLTTAPVLAASVMQRQCYYRMFNGCTSLVNAPELPGEELAELCYSGMFAGCTKMVTPPALPSKTLAKECYADMFNGCSSLSAMPDLPATVLKEQCYRNMFSSCSSLTTAKIPSGTTLAKGCYKLMFSSCYSLTTIPSNAFPVMTLVDECYRQMFWCCGNLTTSPDFPATTLATNCYTDMFYHTKVDNVRADFASPGSNTATWLDTYASTGTFKTIQSKETVESWGVVLDENNVVTTGSKSKIPVGWTVEFITE